MSRENTISIDQSLETLHHFLELTTPSPQIDDYEQYQHLLRGSKYGVPQALSVLIESKGEFVSLREGQRKYQTRAKKIEGWNIAGEVEYIGDNDAKRITVKQEKREAAYLGLRRRYFVSFDSNKGYFDVAQHDELGVSEVYMPGSVSPAFIQGYESMGDVPVYNGNKKPVTSTAVIAEQARFEQRDTLTGFIDIASTILRRFVSTIE